MVKLMAVADAGSIIHSAEINCLDALRIFDKIFISPRVSKELKSLKASQLKLQKLDKKEKNLSAWFAVKHELDLGEAEAITLCKSRGVSLLLTDGLDARIAAEAQGIEPHGSIGIVLRAYRMGMLSKKQTIKALEELESKSTLFITHSLIQDAINAVEKYSKKR